MKNSSWKYPFPTFADKMFDGDKDGKLDAFETAFRDAHLDEMSRKTEKTGMQSKRTFKSERNTNQEQINKVAPGVAQFIIVLIAIVLLIGGFIFALTTSGTLFVRAVILFAAIAATSRLLKFIGFYK